MPATVRPNGGAGPAGGAVDLVRAARELMARAGAWPYPWVFPPPRSRAIPGGRGTIALPAMNAEATVATYIVPVGYFCCITEIMCQIVDSNYVEGLGLATWTIDVNQPAGVAFPIGRPSVLGPITTSMGSIIGGPIRLPRGLDLGPNDQVRFKITLPNPPISGGANPLNVGYPSTTTCWLFGWIWPSEG